MTKNAEYAIDHINSTIVITKRFARAAGILNSSEYKEMMQLRSDNPTYTIVQREIRKKNEKKSYRNLNYENMRAFIAGHETDESARESMLKEFERVQELAKVQAGPYAYVKNWFLEKFGNEYDRKADAARDRQPSEKIVPITANQP